MEYQGKSYHEECFKCVKCELPIGQKSFVIIEGSIYCKICYEDEMAKKCVVCGKVSHWKHYFIRYFFSKTYLVE